MPSDGKLGGKYRVVRTDGRDAPGETHSGCSLFVLDLTHDPAARSAAMEFARACADDRPELSTELCNLVAEIEGA